MRYDEILGLLPRLKGIDTSPGLWLFALELMFWAVVAIFTIALVRYRPLVFEKAETRLREVSRHEGFWLATFILSVIFIRLALLPWMPSPVPIVHDEFSYLLASDTFAHGRLTNPPSPMWVHLESFHINVRPTYQSMYPPGQGLALAAGQKLTGIPWIGVVVSTALMCGAIYWMLLGWLPAPWAWLGGAFACVRFGIFSYWMNSYWGGSVAAIGGALVLGAFPRLRERLTIPRALIFASGLLILANSRPLEGLILSVPLMIAVAVKLCKEIRSGSETWGATAQSILPAMALLAVGATWMLYYNWRGTGNPLVMPYQVNFQTYHFSKPFPFQKPNPIPEYRHQSMRTFYVFYELPTLLKSRHDLSSITQKSVRIYYGFFIWPFSLLILPGAYAIWRSDMRVVLISIALLTANLFAQIWPPQAHYAAPALGGVFLWVLYSVRHYRNSQSEHAIWASRALAVVLSAFMISPIADTLRDPYRLAPDFSGFETPMMKEAAVLLPQHFRRAWIQSELQRRPGKQLIIVHYPDRDMPSQDWIYNDADIDHAHTIWARDMGYLKNKELLDYYWDRQAWYTDRADPATLILPYDQVMAPFKLAFDGPAPEKDSARVSVARQPTPSVVVKPIPVGLTEIVAPHAR